MAASASVDVCVVCGPSGVGKGTLLKKVKDALPNTFGVAVSHTTRKPRPGEADGVAYNFTTREEFEKGIENGEFLEYADVNGNYYGTSVKAVQDVQNKKLVCILEIDVQGAKIIKDSGKIDANYLFITCEGGLQTLTKRLTGRNTETDEQIKRRLNTAEKEFKFLNENDDFFGCVLSNDDLEEATKRLCDQFKSWYSWIKQSTDEEKSNTTVEMNSCPTVVCGPSGVGKGTLLKIVKKILPNTFGVAVSHTTRKPRPGEADGVAYNFATREEFEKGIENGDFVEYAEVNGNYYGTSIAGINNVSTKNLLCILEIDVQGAKIIKDAGKLDAKYLFITCDGGLDTLKQRLLSRNTETDEQIKRRLATAEKEFTFLNENDGFFDCVLSNDDLEASAQRLAQQFKEWYPWIVSDSLDRDAASNDDEKEEKSILCQGRESAEGLFNALQFKTTVFDIRSKEDYNKSHAIGAVNLPDLASIANINKLSCVRIFVYGDGKQNDDNTAKCKKLYQKAEKLRAVQFCVISDGFDVFEKAYPFLCCSDDSKATPLAVEAYPNCVANTDYRVYVGGEAHAFDVNVIKNLGITHIVNTKGTPTKLDEAVAKTLKYCNVEVEDEESESVRAYFDTTGEFIENALKENETNRVLVHCGGGKSRSTTFTMAYLIKHRQHTFAFAYGTVFCARPKALPNDGFVNDLSAYELKIHGKTTKQFIAKSSLRDKKARKKRLETWGIAK
eukprot:CAMPEP_0197035132 /NCGR_PEP_ID=MMETSP1384-20130603/13000_1 /TAXON_ID=29189 /ORGANISM="Ammonia sp." /LENGTH=727 /DNA_ID=CAMNT_0042465147 /DNA_START=15 /DNA_END=2198 /DNA_ORIENTATION=+